MWPSDTCKKVCLICCALFVLKKKMLIHWIHTVFASHGAYSWCLEAGTQRKFCHVMWTVRTPVSPHKAKKALTDTQNTASCKTSQTENTSMDASFSNKGQLLLGDKKQRDPHVLSPDFQNSGLCPVHLIQSPYKKQTPLNSPVKSATKPVWSDETEALLTPKPKNATYFTSYVILDMFEPEKHQTKWCLMSFDLLMLMVRILLLQLWCI